MNISAKHTPELVSFYRKSVNIDVSIRTSGVLLLPLRKHIVYMYIFIYPFFNYKAV